MGSARIEVSTQRHGTLLLLLLFGVGKPLQLGKRVTVIVPPHQVPAPVLMKKRKRREIRKKIKRKRIKRRREKKTKENLRLHQRRKKKKRRKRRMKKSQKRRRKKKRRNRIKYKRVYYR